MKEKEDFIKYCSINAGKSTLLKYERNFKHVEDFFKGKYDNLKMIDVQNFLINLNEKGLKINTQNDIKKVFRRFLRWKYKDWEKRFNSFYDVKLKKTDERKLDLLNPLEVESLLRGCNSIRHIALINLLWESGARPNEILRLKFKDYNENKKILTLYSSKNNTTREIPLNNSIFTLLDWKQKYYTSNPKESDLIFPNDNVQSICQYIKDLGKRVLKKTISPYSLRHTRCNIWFNSGMNPKDYEYVADHSHQVAMKFYQQSDTKRITDKFNEIYNLKELSPEEKSEIHELKKERGRLKKMVVDYIEGTNPRLDKIAKKLEENKIRDILE